jgi:hypothetical protein
VLRFTLHRPSQNSAVSTCCHAMSCRDVSSGRVHVGVRAVPASRAHEARLALATLGCDVLGAPDNSATAKRFLPRTWSARSFTDHPSQADGWPHCLGSTATSRLSYASVARSSASIGSTSVTVLEVSSGCASFGAPCEGSDTELAPMRPVILPLTAIVTAALPDDRRPRMESTHRGVYGPS